MLTSHKWRHANQNVFRNTLVEILFSCSQVHCNQFIHMKVDSTYWGRGCAAIRLFLLTMSACVVGPFGVVEVFFWICQWFPPTFTRDVLSKFVTPELVWISAALTLLLGPVRSFLMMASFQRVRETLPSYIKHNISDSDDFISRLSFLRLICMALL